MKVNRLAALPRFALPLAVLALMLAAGLAMAQAPGPEAAAPLTTAFTYQGRLADDAGRPISGRCDFSFSLWDDAGAGSQVGGPLLPDDVELRGGLFTVELDFGDVFDGTALWLEVGVRCGDEPGYTTLSPRQALTAAPYARHAANAGLLDGYGANAFAPAAHDHWGATWAGPGSGTGLTLSGGTVGLAGSGTAYGVRGQSTWTEGRAVYGSAIGDRGYNYGIYGDSYSIEGRGIYGTATSRSGYTYGAVGISGSTLGTGVIGWTPALTGTTYGAVGASSSNDGTGVLGSASASSGINYGVYGISNSSSGFGGTFVSYAVTSAAAKAGVYGLDRSSGGFGVAGHNDDGGAGVGAWSAAGNLIEAYAGDWPGGDLRLFVDQDGNLHLDGSVQPYAEVPGPDGAGVERRSLYGLSSPEAWLEDFGSAALKDGRATVTLDPAFARTVNLDVEYHVYLTLVCDDLILLGVTRKGPAGFDVQGATLDGRPSACAFDYRIVARQRGYEGLRLERIDIPERSQVESQEIARPYRLRLEWEGEP